MLRVICAMGWIEDQRTVYCHHYQQFCVCCLTYQRNSMTKQHARQTRTPATRATVGIAAVAALTTALSACANSQPSSQVVERQAGVAGDPSLAADCTPAVMVVRHAEDQDNPAGGADILSAEGKIHAGLYPKLFRDYVAETHGVGPAGADATVCPIGRVIAIDPASNSQNNSPGTNPFETIKPLAESLDLPIETKDAEGVSYSTVYDWDTSRRLSLLSDATETATSTVIAWDKQGLNPSADDLSNKTINGTSLGDYDYTPLLRALPTNEAAIVGSGNFTPNRTDLYVFTLPDPSTGTFAFAKTYKQRFSDDGGATWYYTTNLTPGNNPNDIKS
jgi:hypothetical protein